MNLDHKSGQVDVGSAMEQGLSSAFGGIAMIRLDDVCPVSETGGSHDDDIASMWWCPGESRLAASVKQICASPSITSRAGFSRPPSSGPTTIPRM